MYIYSSVTYGQSGDSNDYTCGDCSQGCGKLQRMDLEECVLVSDMHEVAAAERHSIAKLNHE